jgi:hypothetical protein
MKKQGIMTPQKVDTRKYVNDSEVDEISNTELE